MRIPLLLFLATVMAAGTANAQRLSDGARPEHYDLWFAPDLERETFRGRAIIRIQLATAARSVTLHAAELVFTEVTITAAGTTQTARVDLDPPRETATLTVPNAIPAGPATVRVSYTGILNDKLRGFYISRANNRKYAVTQMEATDARRAFPSFDEPAHKATFDVSMLIDAGDTAISNGRLVSDRPGPEAGKHTVTFATTPRMSTYLVAMLVGDFVCREGGAQGTPIRVCSTPDKKALTGFALEAAQQQLKFYNDYFGVRYPFGKLDVVAVPDFAAGAMENAGAITFREQLLLVDPQSASLNARKQVAGILSHEIAHQWFGNLVTMKWWDDIWLNEGFATWMASKPLAQWRPDWRVELDDAQEAMDALGVDALRSTRSIRTRAETPEEINQLFDSIAYGKTAAVLRMVEAYVGQGPFREAVRSYIRKYAYSNAAGEDFWNEVTRVTGKPVDRVMKSFVDQPGAPVVAGAIACTGGRAEITIAQERFIASPSAGPMPQAWTIPACVRPTRGRPRCELLTEPRRTLQADSCSVTLNADSRGYYFSQYAAADLPSLARDVSHLTDVERIGLLGDEWWMVQGGRHDVGLYLDLVQAFAGIDSPGVIETVTSRLDFAASDLVDGPNRTGFEAWIRATFGPGLESIGLGGSRRDSDQLQNRRAALIMLVGVSGNDGSVQRRARDLVTRSLADPSSLSPTVVPAVLRVAAVRGDGALYDRYASQLPALAARPEEYYRYLNALPWFTDPALVARTLDLSLSSSIRSQDTGALIGNVITRPWGRDAGWEFTKAQWKALSERLGTFQGIPAIVGALGSFCSADKAADVRRFFTANPVPSSTRDIDQAVERIENCAAVRARQAPALAKWLSGVR